MAVAKLKYANGAEPTLENPTRGVGWGSAKPVLILKLHNDEIKLLKKRLGDLIGKFEKLIERTGKLEGGQRKITAEMASSFSDVSSNISNFKDQVSKMETFNKSEFAKVKGLITDLKALGLTNMETLSKAITDGDERLDARINEESLSVKEKLEMANNNIELNKRSYNTLDADLVKVASKVTQSEKDIASLNSFVAKHAKTHAEVDAKFKEQGSKLDSVYDEMADFTNDQNAQNQKIAQNLNNHNDLTAD
jgi:chromosome segregation ATPase